MDDLWVSKAFSLIGFLVMSTGVVYLVHCHDDDIRRVPSWSLLGCGSFLGAAKPELLKPDRLTELGRFVVCAEGPILRFGPTADPIEMESDDLMTCSKVSLV